MKNKKIYKEAAADSLSVAELAELVKGIEEKYGVSAAAVAAPVAGAAGAAAAEEKSSFNVVLKEVGGTGNAGKGRRRQTGR